jgi:D-lactate dehydrogenase
VTKTVIAIFEVNAEDRRSLQRQLSVVKQAELRFWHQTINEVDPAEYHDAQIVSVFTLSQITPAVLHKLPKLVLIASRSTGVDHINVRAAKAAGAVVTNVPGYGENTVAEYAFGLLLSVIRKLPQASQQIQTGSIDHTKLTGFELYDKTIGIIGTGKIGAHMARIANGFGMRVLGFDPYPNPQLEIDYGLKYAHLVDLLRHSDVVSIHSPFTGKNLHMIGKTEFNVMKHGAILINTARGELVDSKELVKNLQSGKLGGAGLDVLEDENLLRSSDEVELLTHTIDRAACDHVVEQMILEKMPNVVLSPHNAFNTYEALERIRQTTATNIISFLSGQPENVVDKN